MKIRLIILLALLLPFSLQAQPEQNKLARLYYVLKNATNDTVKMTTQFNLANFYTESNRDSAMYFTEAYINAAKKINQPLWTAIGLLSRSYIVQKQANFTLGLKLCNEALAIIENKDNEKNVYIPKGDEFANDPAKYRESILINAYHMFGLTYSGVGNTEKAIEYWKREIGVAETLQSKNGLVLSNANIGSAFKEMNKLDSAYIYARKALDNARITGWRFYEGIILDDLGQIYFTREQMDSAEYYFRNAIRISHEQNNLAGESGSNNSMAALFERQGFTDSMLYYAGEALRVAYQLNSAKAIAISTNQVAMAWRLKGNADSALNYFLISKNVNDSLQESFNKKVAEFQKMNFDDQMRLEKEAQESIAAKNKTRTMALITGLGLLSILALVFYRNNIQKQKANKILEITLTELRSTQSQLIQSEKMASLGELTAGIAHEIQNPLNFVNNFSEVSNELMDEMKEELDKGEIEEAKTIADNIKQNLEKINHHGKRADAIVKGMLQHSRTSSGKKEPTDINALCDEYLRLAYHGLRAKDKSFNADFKTEFDTSLPKINVIPQEIGRVILNLINNAFYTVSERRKLNESGYEPTVVVSTKKEGDKVLISVKDNGTGIPQKIVDKIFQPFFTTKPTGQGTGLGLSLSYDIVTKGHGGEMRVETKAGEGSVFIIQLPLNG